jgi:hypothetical protein
VKRADGGDDGVPIDNGTRSVDIVVYLIVPISRAFVVEGRQNRELDGEDTVNMFMHTFDGVGANVAFPWTINNALDDDIRAFRTNGKIQAGRRQARYRPVG